MLRILLFFVTVSVIALVIAWFGDNQGTVSAEWLDFRIETSVPVLIAGTLLACVAAYFFTRFFLWFWNLPDRVEQTRKDWSTRRGSKALLEAFSALAAGEVKEAQKLSSKSARLLEEHPLALLLTAQTAQMEGNEGLASQSFSALADRKETEFLGLRGLILQAMRRQDYASALALASRAHKKRPGAPWVLRLLVQLHVRAGRYDDAMVCIRKGIGRAFPSDEADHKMALVLAEQARMLHSRGESQAALAKAKTAVKRRQDFIPAATLLVELVMGFDKVEKAAKLIEGYWRHTPHPDFLELFFAAYSNASPEALEKHVDRLVAQNPESAESHIAVARAAMRAQHWEKARTALKSALSVRETQRLCHLMAELELAERNNQEAARHWQGRAAHAVPDPRWSCSQCKSAAEAWHAFCPSCQGFDTLEWQQPGQGRLVKAAIPELELIEG